MVLSKDRHEELLKLVKELSISLKRDITADEFKDWYLNVVEELDKIK